VVLSGLNQTVLLNSKEEDWYAQEDLNP